jgi:hypothetical protein
VESPSLTNFSRERNARYLCGLQAHPAKVVAKKTPPGLRCPIRFGITDFVSEGFLSPADVGTV